VNIIRRKKGNKVYSYLKCSFRKKDKVITKEVYLGKSIPKNLRKIKEKLKMESKEDKYKTLEKIKDNFQREWRKLPKSIQEKEKEEIAIVFTYNTNSIEGSTITLEETKEIIHHQIAPNRPLSDIKETEAHVKVFLEMLDKREEITTELLLRWHKDIFHETKPDLAGKFRKYLVRVGSYIAPDWQEVKTLISKLIVFINSSKLNPVELSAIAHYRFEMIHPFGDGNGRVGRLLMNLILGYNSYPILIIEHRKRRAYYKALQGGEDKFVNYFLRTYLRVRKKLTK